MGLADGIAGVVRYGYGLKVIAVITAVRIGRSGLQKWMLKTMDRFEAEVASVATCSGFTDDGIAPATSEQVDCGRDGSSGAVEMRWKMVSEATMEIGDAQQVEVDL
ncbi:hypothetical protein LXL04_028741 [Taraxacum kok-saghyz]